MLAQLASERDSPHRGAAIEVLSDVSLLEQLARKAPNAYFRSTAQRRLEEVRSRGTSNP